MLPPIQSTASAGSAFMLSNQTGLKVTAWLTQTSKAGVAPQNAGEQELMSAVVSETYGRMLC